MNKNRLVAHITLIFTAIIVLLMLFWLPAHEEELTKWSIANPLLAPLMIIIIRIVGMLIPPIPGGLVGFALIPIIGWFWSYIYSVIGVTIGAVIAFFLARHFREPIVARFVPLQQLHTWEKKLSHKTHFFAFLLLRLTTGPVIDFVSYIAGLTRISFWKFLLATLIAELPPMLVYYLGGETYKRFAEQGNSYVGIGVLLVLAITYWLLKDHEIFTGKKSTK